MQNAFSSQDWDVRTSHRFISLNEICLKRNKIRKGSDPRPEIVFKINIESKADSDPPRLYSHGGTLGFFTEKFDSR